MLIHLDLDTLGDEELARFASHVAYFVTHNDSTVPQLAAAVRVALRVLSSPTDLSGLTVLQPVAQ